MNRKAELLTAGSEFLRDNNWQKAVSSYAEVLSLDAGNVEALYQLSRIARSAGLSDEAREFLEHASAVNPQDERVKNALSNEGKSSNSEIDQSCDSLEAQTDLQKGSIRRLGDAHCAWNCITELINKDSVVYCAGCGENVSFDVELMTLADCDIFAFDPTPRSLTYMKSLELPQSFKVYDYGFANFDGQTQFNPPVDPTHVSHTIADRPETSSQAITVEMRKISTVMRELGHDHIDLLKMDIEGAEYQVVKDILAGGISVDQILVEFHHFLDSWSYNDTLECILLLLNAGYVLFSAHGHTDYCFVRAEKLDLKPLSPELNIVK